MTTLRKAAALAMEALEGVAQWVEKRPDTHPWGAWQRVEPAIVALRAALAQQEQEPVACPHRDEPRGCYRVRCQLGRKCVEPLYTTPPRREWQGLTVVELQQALVYVGLVDADALDDPDGYDAGTTVSRIDALYEWLKGNNA